jgi:hypothetical protein
VLEEARRHPAPPRTGKLRSVLWRVGLAVAGLVAVYAARNWRWGGLEHAEGRPTAIGAWILAGTLALALGATWLALPARRSMLSPSRGQLLAVAIGVPIVMGAWLMLWHPAYHDPFTADGWKCFALTTLTAPWPFLLLEHVARRLDPRHPALAGAALGATSGAWGAFMLELWCPLALPKHVLVGHVLPLVLVSLAGAAYGAWRLGLRVVRGARRPV